MPARGDGWDVAVVGAGMAGYCAAIEAAGQGARVLLLERETEPGGNSRISAGLIALADTPMQAEAGVRDSADLLFQDLRAVGGEANDPALVRAYAEGQAELARWLTAQGIGFTALEQGGGQSVARTHQTDARGMMARLQAAAAEVTLRTGVRVLRLRCDESIVLETEAGERIPAGSVVLATGGFALSEELLAVFAPGQAGAIRVGAPGNTGDGLRMAWALGAGLRDMGGIKGTFGAHPDSGGARYEALLAFYLGGIVVNRAGQRFVDESISYKLIGEACLHQPGAMGFQVFDEGVMDRGQPGAPLFDLAAALDSGRLLRAETPAALATLCGMDGDGLARTLAAYNAGVKAGEDALGRTGLCNGTGALVRLDRPPFYAFPSRTALLATYCGLAVTPDGAVLDVFGQPIPGLYAAGEVTGGFHGAAYMTGSALGKAAFFGRRAGRAAACRAIETRESGRVR